MQIVINISDIPKNDHERWVMSHGTPLPKGHGRLIDADKFDVYILKDKSEEFIDGAGRVLAQIDDAPQY